MTKEPKHTYEARNRVHCVHLNAQCALSQLATKYNLTHWHTYICAKYNINLKTCINGTWGLNVFDCETKIFTLNTQWETIEYIRVSQGY